MTKRRGEVLLNIKPVARHFLLLILAVAPSLPDVVARLADKRVTESSGVAASRNNPGIYWTHNDSGAGPYLYAFDLHGASHGRWRVPNTRAHDWEDIAAGPGPTPGRSYLYIGDIGDNNGSRAEITVYRIEEPRIAACRGDCQTAPATAIRLRYPDGPQNAEALLVHPKTGDLYIVGKAVETHVYKAGRGESRMSRVATLDVPGRAFATFIGGITGGDISPDGRRVALSDYFRAYEAVLPRGAAFDEIWKQKFESVTIGLGLLVEGICYGHGGEAMIATSEGKPCKVLSIPGKAAPQQAGARSASPPAQTVR
jgi:hypothetical protein